MYPHNDEPAMPAFFHRFMWAPTSSLLATGAVFTCLVWSAALRVERVWGGRGRDPRVKVSKFICPLCQRECVDSV